MSDEIKNGVPTPEENDKQERVYDGMLFGSGAPTTPPPQYEPPKAEQPPKPKKGVPVLAFVLSSIALILAAVMVTFTVCNAVYQKKLAQAQMEASGDYYPFVLFDAMLETYSMEELNEEEMMAAALKAYIYATGDEYAEYYTAEEYDALTAAAAGSSEGIGINVINTTAVYDGVEYSVFRIINVMKDSPAEKAGIKVGDAVFGVGVGESMETVHALGYDVALSKLQGGADTLAQLTVRRGADSSYETLPFEITRAKVTTTSVYAHALATDPTVGIVRIVQFDLTTPTQFCEAVDGLLASGCTKFVFDVRYNPGGDLCSIEALLSYFLDEDDILIQTRKKSGEEEISRVKEVTYSGNYAGCSVKKSDIGKYQDLTKVILCNGSTASAAELFTATFRDYDKLNATIVGTTTFGKGSMQQIMPLMYYGYEGALKLTVAMYYPASGEGYDGVGITPDVVVELSEAAASKNIYELADADDNQLQKALEYLQ